MRAYIHQVFIAVDQLSNALLGGWVDETFSSRCHREFPRAAKAVDVLLFFDPAHCKRSYESELHRNQLPIELR